MAEQRNWYYERLKPNGKLERLKTNDYDGSITGKIVFNVPAYFDENPDEARRLGWTKHIQHSIRDLREMGLEWDPITQYLARSVKRIDEWTVEDEFTVMDKTEEELARAANSRQHTSGIFHPDRRFLTAQVDEEDLDEYYDYDWEGLEWM